MMFTSQERAHYNEIYGRLYRKYFGQSSGVHASPLKHTEAITLATEEIDAQIQIKITQINTDYNARVLVINNEAAARGLLNSSVVMQQLQQAANEKQAQLDVLTQTRDTKIQTLAGRMMSANAGAVRAVISADRDSFNRIKSGITDLEKQKALDEEMYAEYLAFLLVKTKVDALSYVNSVGGEYSIFDNLSPLYVTKLQNTITARLA